MPTDRCAVCGRELLPTFPDPSRTEGEGEATDQWDRVCGAKCLGQAVRRWARTQNPSPQDGEGVASAASRHPRHGLGLPHAGGQGGRHE